jgi:hypothetical protein
VILVKRVLELDNEFLDLILDDPVRPSIPAERRLGHNKDIFYCRGDDGEVSAITCVSYNDFIPSIEEELFIGTDNATVAVFYTIWSYKPGVGRRLLNAVLNQLLEEKENLQRFVTLSPKTEMARKFHLRNGAFMLKENAHTINYEYIPT